MMQPKRYILLLALLAAVSGKATGLLDNLQTEARLGYMLGGTAPVGMPSTIRGMSKYTLQPNWTCGVAAEKRISARWGAMTGLYMENKDMHVDARVKGYHLEIVRGGEQLDGCFTGHVDTKVREWMLTLPLMATYTPAERLRLRCGPYASVLLHKKFSGWAYNGHLRKGDPTGAKVLLGNDASTRGSFDFSSHMRSLQVGVAAGADYRIGQQWGMFLDLSWGLTGIHHSNFHTIEQTLYPIYGTLGFTYRLKSRN